MPRFLRLPTMCAGALLALLPSVAAAQTVEGTVVNSVTGDGVAGVQVDLIQGGEKYYSATTDAHGHFLFDHVQDGAYTANYSSPDFFFLDPGRQRQQRFQVTAGGNPVELEARMTPLARISGRVVDGKGKPVPGAPVSVISPNAATTIPADKDGKFDLHKFMLPGAYTLSVAPPAGLRPPDPEPDRVLNWTRTYYPGVTTLEAASKISLLPGSEVTDLELKLLAVPAHAVRGVLLNPDGTPAPKVAIALGADLDQLRTESDSDGAFEFPAVVDGEWQCTAEAEAHAGPASVKLRASEWFEMAGHERQGLKLRLAAPFTVRGKVAMQALPGAPAPRPPGLVLGMKVSGAIREMLGDNGIVVGATPGSPNARPDADGNFSVPDVYPGAYRIIPLNGPPGYYLDSIRMGDAEVSTEEVEISSSAASFTLVYKTNGGAVRGVIENCASGGVVVLPQDPALRRPGFQHSTGCDGTGALAASGASAGSSHYEVDALRPGDYYVLAIAGDGPNPWYRARLDDTLLNQATKVTVRAGETTSTDLHAITQEIR